MKAVRYHSYGDSDVLVYEEADRPVAGAGQVVVRVAGTSFNPVDAAIRAGLLQQVFPVAFPHVPSGPAAAAGRPGRRPRRGRRRTAGRQDRPDPA
jgi:NADPH:quinone reductase-like Zn-dependent oxidoreductase